MGRLRKKPFKVSVDLMAEPCLWRWEIRDPKTDEVMASSWADEWEAYETSEHALRAVGAQLSSMAHAPRRRAWAAMARGGDRRPAARAAGLRGAASVLAALNGVGPCSRSIFIQR